MSLLNHIHLSGDRFVKVAVINKQVRVCLQQNAGRYIDIGVQDLFLFVEWIFTHVPFTESKFKGGEFTVDCDCNVKIANQRKNKSVTWSEIDLALFVERFAYITAAVQYWQSQIQILQTVEAEEIVE